MVLPLRAKLLRKLMREGQRQSYAKRREALLQQLGARKKKQPLKLR